MKPKHTTTLATALAFAAAAAFCAMPQTALAKGVTPKPGENPDISYTVSFGKELSKTPAKRTITIPNVGEFRVLKGDFHIHTLFSDGRVWPTQRVIEADGNGLDVIAITDHIEYRPFVGGVPRKNKAGKVTNFPLLNGTEDYNLSYEIAKVEAGKRKLLLVRGTEITKSKMPPGHVNALFVTDVNKIAAKQDDFREMFKEAVAQGGFLLWNHPGWEAPKSGGIEKGAPTTFTDVHTEMYEKGWMHGIEAFNGKQFYPVVAKWCADKNLAVFANSDIHPPEFDMYGVRNPLRPITLVLAKEKTLESVREAFFAKRTIGWAANMIFGQEKWVRQLFDACVEIKKEGAGLSFVNRSSIVVKIKVGDQTVQLNPLATASVSRAAGTISVENWLVGKYKPLTVSVD